MWVEIFKMHLEWGWKVKEGGGWFRAKPQRERSMLHRRSRSGSRSIAVVGSSTGQRHPSREKRAVARARNRLKCRDQGSPFCKLPAHGRSQRSGQLQKPIEVG